MGFSLHSSEPCVLGSGWKWELNLPYFLGCPDLAHFCFLLQSWETFPLPPFGFQPCALVSSFFKDRVSVATQWV